MPSFESKKYDFIVVGSGPGGAAIARRLADSKKTPSVLLLEAGGPNDEVGSRLLANRLNVFLTYPHYDWGYQSVPQSELNDRVLPLARGKGLGGSTSNNLLFWTIGPKDDYDEWARRVGDDEFNWSNASRRYKSIEAYKAIQNPDVKKYANPVPDHATNGAVGIEYPPEYDSYLPCTVKAALDAGLTWNDDCNSGDPLGIGMLTANTTNSMRNTSADAYLRDPPKNLTVKTNSHVTKILFEGNKAIGVSSVNGTYYAGKEVILSCGAVDTPKLLLLSGIGPKLELDQHGIETIVDLPFVGKNLEDHIMAFQSVELKPGVDAKDYLLSNPQKLVEAKERFLKDGTGPAASFYGTTMVGFSKPDQSIYDTEEFKNLSEEAKEHIKLPTVPSTELAWGAANLNPFADPTKSYLTIATIVLSCQSKGTVTLRSANSDEPPVIDPQYLKSPFDRKILIDAMRKSYQLLTHPIVAQGTLAPFNVPSGQSDEEIWGYIQAVGTTTWHLSCTVKMGKADDPEACVTTDFRVKGVEGLRVVDLSVTPFVPKAHPQSVAYFIGETAAEKMIADYGLNE